MNDNGATIVTTGSNGERIEAFFATHETAVIVRVNGVNELPLITSTNRVIWSSGAIRDELASPQYHELRDFFERVLKRLES